MITDLAMPVMDGYQMIEKMRADAELREIPVIVATSRKLSAEQMRGLPPRPRHSSERQLFGERGGGQALRNALDSRSANLLAKPPCPRF